MVNRIVPTVVTASLKKTVGLPAGPKVAVPVGPDGGALGVQLVGSFQSTVAPFQVAFCACASGAPSTKPVASIAATRRRR